MADQEEENTTTTNTTTNTTKADSSHKSSSDSNSDNTTVEQRIEALCISDATIGWPTHYQSLPIKLHGWFRAGNVAMLRRVLQGLSQQQPVTCVIELGSWLGKSTKFICEQAPHAIVYAADIWSNEYFLSDTHYDKKDTVFAEILKKPIYDQFLSNLADHRYHLNTEGKGVGLLPLRMISADALEKLKMLNIKPEVIYIDASHHFDYVVQDVTTCLDYFPEAIIIGDDWDNEDVKRAVKKVAKDRNKEIKVELGSCWTFHVNEYSEFIAKEESEERRKKE